MVYKTYNYRIIEEVQKKDKKKQVAQLLILYKQNIFNYYNVYIIDI